MNLKTLLLRLKDGKGDAQAQFDLGKRYAADEGVPKAEAEAAAWFCKAAEQGHADAQASLGLCLQRGMGVVQNEVDAVAWFDRAASRGHARAQLELECYRDSAEHGDVDAQYALGLHYYQNGRSSKERKKGLSWIYAAAKQGHVGAKRVLDDRDACRASTSYYRPSVCLSMAQPRR